MSQQPLEETSSKRKLDLDSYTYDEVMTALKKYKRCVITCPFCSRFCTEHHTAYYKNGSETVCEECSHECVDPNCDDDYGSRVFKWNEYRHEECFAPTDSKEDEEEDESVAVTVS